MHTGRRMWRSVIVVIGYGRKKGSSILFVSSSVNPVNRGIDKGEIGHGGIGNSGIIIIICVCDGCGDISSGILRLIISLYKRIRKIWGGRICGKLEIIHESGW